ncbi:MAG: hypothetical protein EBR54_07025 [Flavobacteriia bacterium]|nr:hypothetical protein [Flavobacteriia bacterium]
MIRFLFFLPWCSILFAQTPLEQKEAELKLLKAKMGQVSSEIEQLKLAQCMELLQVPGFPKSPKSLEIVKHSAYAIGFDCEYKMPAWTFHVVTPDITFGNVSRTNDFRPDSSVSCGSSNDNDYFTFSKDMKTVERSVHQIKIPDWHYKIVADLSLDTPRGMAFLMPNRKCEGRPSSYVVSIDSIEKLTGLDFFPKLSESMQQSIEGKADFNAWKTQSNSNDVEPLNALELPKGFFNTQQALSKVGSTCTVVGKVVSAKFSTKSEATFLNLDQSFPKQIFSVMIWKDGRKNFSYKPEVDLYGKYIAVKGRVDLDKNGVPGIMVEREEQIQLWEEGE